MSILRRTLSIIKGADEYGKSQAIPELGWEIASNALAIGTFGGSKLVTFIG